MYISVSRREAQLLLICKSPGVTAASAKHWTTFYVRQEQEGQPDLEALVLPDREGTEERPSAWGLPPKVSLFSLEQINRNSEDNPPPGGTEPTFLDAEHAGDGGESLWTGSGVFLEARGLRWMSSEKLLSLT